MSLMTSFAPAPPKAPLRVMIVDDDPIALEVARDRLEEAGYVVVTRSTAIGTSLAIAQERPDVLLLDVNMPALRGDALARLGDVRARKIIVLLHSSEPRPVLEALAQKCGAAGIVEKTHDDAQFLSQIRAAIDRAR